MLHLAKEGGGGEGGGGAASPSKKGTGSAGKGVGGSASSGSNNASYNSQERMLEDIDRKGFLLSVCSMLPFPDQVGARVLEFRV